MPLSEDQKAMLRLLAQRGEQGYEDIAALMSLSVDEVRVKVREAVRQLEEEGLPPPALPIEPAAPEPPAAEPVQKVPEPEPSPKKAAEPSSSRPRLSLPSGRGPLVAIGAAIAVIVVIALVLIFGGGGDDGDSSTRTDSGAGQTSPGAGNTPVTNSKQVTKAVLSATDGSDAAGEAIFGREKNSLALLVQAEGLAPTASGQSYTIWLAQSPQRMLPLASTRVDKSGQIAARFRIPVEVLAYLANETFDKLAITLTDNSELEASLAEATKAKESPAYTGTEVLRGTVVGPIVGAASR